MFLNTARKYLPGQFRELDCSPDHWHCVIIWELLPFVAIGNDGKQRIVNVDEPVRPLVPVHHVSVEPNLDCLPNLPGALVALSLSRIWGCSQSITWLFMATLSVNALLWNSVLEKENSERVKAFLAIESTSFLSSHSASDQVSSPAHETVWVNIF